MSSRPGDRCEAKDCTGRLKVYVTRINFSTKVRTRYLHCPICKRVPEMNKWIVPLEYAPAQKRNGG